MINFSTYKNWVYPLIALILGLLTVQFRVLGFDFSRIPGDLGDARFNMYLLEHAYQFSTGQWAEYWNAGFFYPGLESISYSDNLLGASPLYSIARVIGGSREGAFQFWILSMTVLNFLAAYFLFLRWSNKEAWSALGAFVYAFSLVLFSQMYHVQTMPRFAFPLMLLFFYRFHEQGKVRFLVLAVWMLVWQFWCGIYLGFFALFVGVLFAICSLPFYWKKYFELIRNWKSLLFFGLSSIMATLVMLKLMAPYMRRAEHAIPYTQERILATVPRLGSYFYSMDDTLLWGVLSEVGDQWKWSYTQTLFIGGVALTAVFLCLILLFKKDFRNHVMSKKVLPFALTGLITFSVFIKWGGFSIYLYLLEIPGFGALRSLDRMINLELLFAGMAVVGVLYYLMKGRRVQLIFGIMLIFLLMDNYKLNVRSGTFSKKDAQQRIENLRQKIVDLEKHQVLAYQPETLVDNVIFYQIDAMLAAQAEGIRTVNGYSATSPYGFDLFWRELNDEGRRKWMEMSGADTTHVVVVH